MKPVSALVLLFITMLISSCNYLQIDSNPGNKYALVYGISIYDQAYAEGVSQNLTWTDDDASELADRLTDLGYSVTLRINQSATTQNLSLDIQNLNSVMNPEDTLLFYFSGHGSDSTILPVEGEDEWIFLYGSLNASGIEDLDLALTDDELSRLIAASTAGKRLVIIDACNSGGFIGSSPDTDLTPSDAGYMGTSSANEAGYTRDPFAAAAFSWFTYDQQNLKDVDIGTAQVLTAAGEREESLEVAQLSGIDVENGIFTYTLLEALSVSNTGGYLRGDLNRNGYVDTSELYRYIRHQFENFWNPLIARSAPSLVYLPHISGGSRDFQLTSPDVNP